MATKKRLSRKEVNTLWTENGDLTRKGRLYLEKRLDAVNEILRELSYAEFTVDTLYDAVEDVDLDYRSVA